jgi:hypothetical protein
MHLFTIEEGDVNNNLREMPSGMYLHGHPEQPSIEEVARVCPTEDDTNIRSLTIRSLIIGLVFVLGMSFYHMWYYFTDLYAEITPVIVVLLAHVVGKIWAMIDNDPWTMKEHTVVLIMSNIAWTFAEVYDFSALSFLEYQERTQSFQFIHLFFFVIAIQFLGFGLAGEF